MTAYPIKSMPATMVKYPIYVRNDEIPIVLVKNDYFQNRICTKPIEIIEGRHSSGFKVIPISSSA